MNLFYILLSVESIFKDNWYYAIYKLWSNTGVGCTQWAIITIQYKIMNLQMNPYLEVATILVLAESFWVMAPAYASIPYY